jgi:hypothetical protein
VHLDLVVKILLAGFLGLLESRFGSLCQSAGILAIEGVVSEPGLE